MTDQSLATRPSDQPSPTREEIVARVRGLQPLIAANGARGEQDRRVPEETISALREAGAFKIGVPARFGGYETDVRTMLDVSGAVGEADGGTAWAVTLMNVCAWLTGTMSEQAQEDVWGANPDARISGVLTPTAEVVKVDGGYRVNGRWYYNSGSWHSDWANLGIPIVDEHGEVVDQGSALIPKSELQLEETWFVAGMRASGSNCLVANDVFVPEHRIFSVPEFTAGNYLSPFKDEAYYRSSAIPVLALVLAGPQLGMGRRALQIVREKAATKPISYTYFKTQSESVGFQLQIAKAAMLIDTAHLHAYRAADDIDRAAAEGGSLNELARCRVRADTALVLQNVTRAIDILLFAHGAGSFAETNELQRLWRDSAVAARHAVTLPEVNFEIYGKALLGRSDQITHLI
ncbi:acyl-CoA dehydrogenase family protein [Rhodococcus qingshengii]|uniref:acyl-CoA dehydrogenase family protein n=1 Tax=Rhodococcus qingshengii TaxID=334542 RepID=UPI00237CF4B6|nr:acyl-CoA dehydrogenase family protein [Rhodococcus qingshengii]WCT05747.1 oxidoreductase [Rhodococcus qingshengii]